MSGSGTATVNFGVFPGDTEAQVVVTGQTGILSGSLVEAWISLEVATADHSEDEHLIENFRVRAGTIVPGTGFTIYAEAQNPWRGDFNAYLGRSGDHMGAPGNLIYGAWTINWVWA